MEKKYIDMNTAERAAYRKRLIREYCLGMSDEALDDDLSRHANYDTIWLSFKAESND